MFLFHLLIHAYINQQSLNVFFGKRSVDACIQRILYLKSILINEGLVDDYSIPECKYCNDSGKMENEEYEETEFKIEENESKNEINDNFQNNQLIECGTQTLNRCYQKQTSLKEKQMQLIVNERMQKMRNAKTKKNRLKKEKDELIEKDNGENFVLKYSIKRILGELKSHYNDEEKNFWLSVYLLGKRLFEFISKLLHGPCINSIKNWIKCANIPSFDDLMKLENLRDIIFWWYGENLPKYINISIDALKVDEDIYITSKKEVIGVIDEKPVMEIIRNMNIDEIKNDSSIYTKIWNRNIIQKNIVGGLFVILVCPICESKCYPIYIVASPNGFASDQIDKQLKDISSTLRSMGMKPIFISSDSDSHYRSSFHHQFEYWKNKFIMNNGDVNGIELKDEFKCNDGSHILKRARSHLVRKKYLFVQRYDQVLFNGKQGNINIPNVSPNTLSEYSNHLMNCWFRNNSFDSMDDYFPIKIFNSCVLGDYLEKIGTVSENDERKLNALIAFILPMCCLNCVLHSKDTSRCALQKWSYVGIYILLFYHSFLKIDGIQGKKISKEKFNSLFSMNLCEDASTHLFSIIYALQTIPEKFSMNRIGTIMNEHFFQY